MNKIKHQKSPIEKLIEKQQELVVPLDPPKENPAPVADLVTPKVQYRKYLICPFCEKKQFEQTGIDQGSSWCIQCGKAFMVDWKQEPV